MITKGCGVLGLIAAAIMFPLAPNNVSAADLVEITKAVKTYSRLPLTVTENPVKAKLDFKQTFSSISSVCFRFTFVDDFLVAPEGV